jgi:hypothetical protein
MSSWLHQSAVMGILLILALVQVQPAQLAVNTVDFERGAPIRAIAPNGKLYIELLLPATEDADPVMRVVQGKIRIPLGVLRRSAVVSWRPDSEYAIIRDCAFSNRCFLRLLRAGDRIGEVPGLDALIRRRALGAMRIPSRDVAHYWPTLLGWTATRELVIGVCADGLPPGRPPETGLIGFSRGYIVDVERLRIKAELEPARIKTTYGLTICE